MGGWGPSKDDSVSMGSPGVGEREPGFIHTAVAPPGQPGVDVGVGGSAGVKEGGGNRDGNVGGEVTRSWWGRNEQALGVGG